MSDPNSEHKFTAAYDRMLERVQQFFDDAGPESAPTIQQRIELARQRAVEFRELTSDEADKIAAYVERDLHEAADYLQQSGQTFATWFKFDISQIESRLFELFFQVSDRTRLELNQLAEQARRNQQYHTGEIATIGSLACDNCGTQIDFKKTGRIPPCHKCHKTLFKRAPR